MWYLYWILLRVETLLMLNKNHYFLLFSILLLLGNHGNSWAQSLAEVIQQRDLLICSHRGASHPDGVENSISSLQQARSAGIILHEIDIRQSLDGELFLLHDETLDRTTNLTGNISDTHSSVLRNARLKSSNEILPSFESALIWARENNAYLMLDVKTAPLQVVMIEVEKWDMLDRVMLLTFTKSRVEEALANFPNFLVSVLIENSMDLEYYNQRFIHKENLLGYVNKTADLALFNQVNEAGIPIVTDTMGEVDEAAESLGLSAYQEFIQQTNPRIVVSDYPLLLLEAVKREGL